MSRSLTAQFLFDIESRWRVIQENSYAALSSASNLWWSKCSRFIPSTARTEHLVWVLDTVDIQGRGPSGGTISFEDMTTLETNFTNEFANAGLKLLKSQLLDTDQNGINLGAAWMQGAAQKAVYWPQRQISTLLKYGATSTYGLAYDGKTFFASDHPVNPKDTRKGTYSNIIASAGVYGAATNEVALQNLQKVSGAIRSLKMADGITQRFLQPKAILCSSVAYPYFAQITNAKFLALSAGSSGTSGGSGDIEGHLQSLGFGDVIECPELNGFESDTTYFVLAQAAGVPQNEMSAGFAYLEREPFATTFYTGAGGGNAYVDAVLDRENSLEWHIQGRNKAGYGHPFAVFKCTA